MNVVIKKIILFTGAALVLASCQKPAADKGKYGAKFTGDSSPIIISEGSLHINQRDNFRVHGTKTAAVRLGGYAPTQLGFTCDPVTQGNCAVDPCAEDAQENCQVDLSVLSSWSLILFDSNTKKIATLKWDMSTDDHPKRSERVAISFEQDLAVNSGSGTGVDLLSSQKLIKAKLKTGGAGDKIYNFVCPTTGKCKLRINYYCSTGCEISEP